MGYPFKMYTPYKVYRGDALSIPVKVGTLADPTDPSSLFTGEDLTLLGSTWTAKCSIAENSSDVIAIAVDPSQAALGILTLSVAGSIVQTMYAAMYIFDIQVTGGPIDPLTLCQGQFEMWGDITRG